MPIFMRSRSSFLLPHASRRPFHRIAHHGAPLLTRDAIEVLAERPVSSVWSRGATRDRAAERGAVLTIEIGPRRADKLGVMRVARARLRDVEHRRVEPGRARPTHSPRV